MRSVLYLFLLATILISCKKESPKTTTAAEFSCSTPVVNDYKWYKSGKKAPFFKGLKGVDFLISSKNKEAQRYFEQGLMLSYGFNHAESARSFFEVTRQDPNCAMGWWGFAYVLGPNYNAGMEKDNFVRAYEAVTKAKSLAQFASPKEKDLIEALAHRYSKDTTIARTQLDSAYAIAMKKVHLKYPDDADIASLYAESLMDLHPWNLWLKNGKMQPWTPQIIAALQQCLKINPKHVGGNHFYIHATEMSQHAEEANKSADLLRNLVPGSGHLLHMPSHTYIRTGRYHDGVLSNLKAVEVDSLYTVACHAQGAYVLGYYPHNYHFLAACATLSGESKMAIKGAFATSNHAHKKLLRDPAWSTLQHYYSIPYYVQVKLGLWNEILSSKAPEKDLKYPLVIWHYAQGMALLSRGKNDDAKKHLVQMNQIMTDPKIKDLTIWGINSVYDLCEIASKTLEGEIYGNEKKYNKAIALLKEAVNKETSLNYNEPPDWFFSVRHHLGAVLLEAKRYEEAKNTYLEDLKIYRNNGWALKGLMNAYEKLGDQKNYNQTKIRFDKAWQYADIKINSSRIL
jgi:tetratricopeptide (TPR) repeat protein